MSIYKMSSAKMMQFVEMYRDRECLWNVDSPLYKDRNARDTALKEISDGLHIEGFGPRETAQKIKNLRTTYNQEIKKIASSRRSGTSAEDNYKPKVTWFGTVDAFLRKRAELEPTTANVKQESRKTTPVTPEILEDIPTKVLEVGKTPQLKKRVSTKRCTEKVLQINEAIPNVEGSVNKVIKKDDPDEFDIFGCYIASALKTLPTENAIKAQTNIVHVLAEEKIKAAAAKTLRSFDTSSHQSAH